MRRKVASESRSKLCLSGGISHTSITVPRNKLISQIKRTITSHSSGLPRLPRRPRLLLAILAAHSLHSPIVRMVRGNQRWQSSYGGQRSIRARVGSVRDTVMLLAVDLHAVYEKVVDWQDLGYSEQEVFQLP